MEYKYVIILFHEDGTVWRVYKLKNKKDLRDRVSYEVEHWTHMIVLDIHAFNYSDNDIIKRARKSKDIFEL